MNQLTKTELEDQIKMFDEMITGTANAIKEVKQMTAAGIKQGFKNGMDMSFNIDGEFRGWCKNTSIIVKNEGGNNVTKTDAINDLKERLKYYEDEYNTMCEFYEQGMYLPNDDYELNANEKQEINNYMSGIIN